jgi:hypothetical protein
MSDRTPKPGTAIYLLRDVPRTDLKAAHAALEAAGEQRTLKDALLGTISRLAASQARKGRRKAAKVQTVS